MDDEIVALHGASKPSLLTCALCRVPALGLFLGLALLSFHRRFRGALRRRLGNLPAYKGTANNDSVLSAGPRIGLKTASWQEGALGDRSA